MAVRARRAVRRLRTEIPWASRWRTGRSTSSIATMAMRKPSHRDPGTSNRTRFEPTGASAASDAKVLMDGANVPSNPGGERQRPKGRMRGPEKINALALAGVALLFYVLALTPIGELWEQHPEVRDVYLWIAIFLTVLTLVLRRAEFNRIPSLDRWMVAVWVMIGFAVFGLAPLWPVLLLSLLFGEIVRLEAGMAFQSFGSLARRVRIE